MCHVARSLWRSIAARSPRAPVIVRRRLVSSPQALRHHAGRSSVRRQGRRPLGRRLPGGRVSSIPSIGLSRSTIARSCSMAGCGSSPRMPSSSSGITRSTETTCKRTCATSEASWRARTSRSNPVPVARSSERTDATVRSAVQVAGGVRLSDRSAQLREPVVIAPATSPGSAVAVRVHPPVSPSSVKGAGDRERASASVDFARYGIDLLAVPRQHLDSLSWDGRALTVHLARTRYGRGLLLRRVAARSTPRRGDGRAFGPAVRGSDAGRLTGLTT